MTPFSNTLIQMNKPTLEADQDSDQTLIARFVQKQDQVAFEILVKRYHGLVMGVCHRVLGNAADAEEAHQATFILPILSCFLGTRPLQKGVPTIIGSKLLNCEPIA